MNEQASYHVDGVTVTTDFPYEAEIDDLISKLGESFDDKLFEMQSSIEDEFEELSKKDYQLYELQLRKWMDEFPQHEVFYDLLISLYARFEKKDLELKVLMKRYELFSHKPVAKIELASAVMSFEGVEAYEQFFGASYDIQDVFPDATSFHVGEYLTFNALAIDYLCSKKKIAEAKKVLGRLSQFNELDPEIIDEFKQLIEDASA